MDFVLTKAPESINPGPAYACAVIGWSYSKVVPELAVAKVEPPYADLRGVLHDVLLFAVRLDYTKLSDPAKWPKAVYVCIPLSDRATQPGSELQAEDYTLDAWGELYPPETLGELQRIHALAEPDRRKQLDRFSSRFV